jgi:hypothetical protein
MVNSFRDLELYFRSLDLRSVTSPTSAEARAGCEVLSRCQHVAAVSAHQRAKG